ncbi:adenylate/guanylate cyclase domain-containing protein [Knoellia sp. p5-6-4]|uniref:adenylate/guanylate cyclase domain-containing protein n=1 Tax=unclassified Knoellia TaxID=2618719 RepID=UPI0023DB7BC6|nr:adenylate/guanylate cyclase domain-containing protein [Knoellia sp. p5-6-4]MDF2146746.1 adenylate/guanylate cyclase domain-containing protein [Knoellia sp. p5-6-4]
MADKGHQWTPDEVRAFMRGESPEFARERRRFMRIPANPRCKLCLAPFGGVGGVMFKAAGFGRSPGNPSMCVKCQKVLRDQGLTGVEIPVTLLFSDIRGSTGLGERMRPSEFKDFLDRFYRLATDAIVHNDGLVDKIVGDEVIGLFFGGISGPNHAGAAIAAATELADRTSRPNASPMGPIPAGTAVHTGDAFVGSTGPEGTVHDFTALGDPVNTTARLASLACAGEVIVSVAAAEASGTNIEGLERRRVELRGRSAPLEVVVLRAAQAGMAARS